MRRLVALIVAAGALLVAAPAQAVTYSYCNTSLRGGGTLAPDFDVKKTWDYLEESRGIDITSSYAIEWSGPDGASSVYAEWIFWRANGDYIRGIYYACWGSGASYGDGRSI